MGASAVDDPVVKVAARSRLSDEPQAHLHKTSRFSTSTFLNEGHLSLSFYR